MLNSENRKILKNNIVPEKDRKYLKLLRLISKLSKKDETCFPYFDIR